MKFEKEDLEQFRIIIREEVRSAISEMLLPKHLNTKEAIKLSGLSKSTLENYRRDGKLGDYKIGALNIYKRSELNSLVSKVG